MGQKMSWTITMEATKEDIQKGWQRYKQRSKEEEEE